MLLLPSSNLRFPGQGQRPTPVTDARGAVVIMNLLPGRKAAQFRLTCADVMVRFLGGDETLIAEIKRNHEFQGFVDETNPLAFFGDAAGPPIVFHPSSSLGLKSVTGVTNFRQSQYYLRRVDGNWHNVHPVGRPQDVLTPEELADLVVIKAGAQGEITGRQGTHLTTYSDSTLLRHGWLQGRHVRECTLVVLEISATEVPARYSLKTSALRSIDFIVCISLCKTAVSYRFYY